MIAVAAPIGSVQMAMLIGAIVIAGAEMRLSEEKMLGLAPLLIEASNELSLAMVARPARHGGARGAAGSIFATSNG